MTTNNHESVGRVARYAQHVADLCDAFGVLLQVSRTMAPHEAGAGTVRGGTRRVILIVPVTDESTYAVALHELGHCVHPLGMLHDEGSHKWRDTNEPQTRRDLLLILEQEIAAWEWAMHYALEWTPLMDAVKSMSLNEYERQIKKRTS